MCVRERERYTGIHGCIYIYTHTWYGGRQAQTQESLVAQVRAATRMNDAYARQCLVENGWDVAAAVATWMRVRDGVPPEAYQ
jgi:hypothetical protein